MTSFKRYKNSAFIAVAALSALWIFNCTFVRQDDLNRFFAFKEKQHEIDNSSKLVSKNTYQTRSDVRKDIWTAEEDHKRLHYRIESKSSILKLVPGEKKAELVENLQDIKCWMQDKLYTGSSQNAPMQQVRYLEADRGTYRYSAQQFDARTVSISLLRLPGHRLSFDVGAQDAFLKGIAQRVSFSISDGTPQFQAQNFKASIKGNEL